MTITEWRDAMKGRLDIPLAVTTFDSYIQQCVYDAIDQLAPTVWNEVAVQEKTVTPSRGEVTVDLSTLSTPLSDVRKVDASGGDGEWPADAFTTHAGMMQVRELPSNVTKLFIYGLIPYTVSTLPSYLNLAVYNFAQSYFYTFLMANKAKYNTYMQNGSGAVDNMQDLVDFFEQKGVEALQDKAVPYGR